MKIISFKEAINAFNNQNYQLVHDYVKEGNQSLEFNFNQLVSVEF